MPRPPESTAGVYLTRRKLLLVGLGLMVLAWPVFKLMSGSRTLIAFADTLLPEDEFGPAASATGAVEKIEQRFSGSAIRRAELQLLIIWLNLAAWGSFADASQSTRDTIVELLDQLPVNSVRWKIYRRARESAVRHYFGSAKRAQAMGLSGAPQPEGFPDAHRPWHGSRHG